MSSLSVNAIVDANGGSSTSINGFTPSVSNMAGRNRIINGAMMIDQRNAGASVTPTNAQYITDRWAAAVTATSKFTAQQSTTAPSGYINSLVATSSSAYTIGSGDIFAFFQRIEGLNIADFGWGTSSAAPATISFWVRSSLTGTFGGAVQNSAQDRSYPFTYSISSANTWEQKSVTIPGDTSGTWLTTNGIGLNLSFGFGVGSTYSSTANSWGAGNYWSATGATSVVGTSGATFYITGVQLERGSVATPFENRQYGTELALCQRYCHAYSSYSLGRARDSDTVYGGGLVLSPTMRATPTLRSGASFAVNTGSAGTPQIFSATGTTSSPDNVYITNASVNWTSPAQIALTGIFEAEL